MHDIFGPHLGFTGTASTLDKPIPALVGGAEHESVCYVGSRCPDDRMSWSTAGVVPPHIAH